MITKLFRNARIFTPWDQGQAARGEGQGRITSWRKGAILCCDGLIKDVGPEEEVLKGLEKTKVDQESDCRGSCLIPGFVDPHTHMCFVRLRESEFGMRLDGVEYLEILRKGGGILSSVKAIRETSEETLFETTRRNALSALRFGTTTLEIKSGYGLDTASELMMLRVIHRVGRETPLAVIPTFMGAHAVPLEYVHDSEGYVELLIHEMIPSVKEQGIAQCCDVFCEHGVFSVDQTRRILEAAKKAGLMPKVHADEVHNLGGAALAAEVGVVSAEHLLAADDAGLKALAERGVIAVLLPGTAYSLRKPYARGREMIDMGVPVALATDCNPGSCYTESVPFIFGLAVLNMGLTVNEALTAVTLNASYAVGLGRQVGSLQTGKSADFLLLDGESPAILAYHAGTSPVTAVYKKAELVWQ